VRVLGIHIAVLNGRYLAGFAVLDDSVVEQAFTFGGPPDEPEAGQLRELHSRVLQLVAEKQPDAVALRVSEIQQSATRSAVAHRGEGAVLSAVGETRGLPVSYWVRASLVRGAGWRTGTSVAVVNDLCGRLEGAPTEGEQRQAAAAAVAALLDAGVV
jgi:hypothetical protein